MSDTKPELAIAARGVSRSYRQGGQEISVLRNLELAVRAGETVAILGVSGSGKSTLLHLLAGLDRPDAGRISLAGVALDELSSRELARLRNRRLGFVYQFHHLLPEFSALENVAMPLLIGGEARTRARARAAELLAEVGLAQRLSHHPGALSGGERQRVAIARALIARPEVVLADEPTGNLDEQSAGQVRELMLQLTGTHGAALVVVTHNAGFAADMRTVYRLHHGALEAAG